MYAHPFIIGELACGNLGNRQEVLELLQGLPQLSAVPNESVLRFIEERQLMGRGIGYVDAHLLTATALHGEMRIWTLDKRLKAEAEGLLLVWTAESH